jgi:hypothetical protein
LYDIWLEKYAKDEDRDWKSFCYEQFYADWAECTPEEIAKLQTKAFLKFYLTKFRFLKVFFSLKRNQIFMFAKRVLKVIFANEFYNRLFTKKVTNLKFINPSLRKKTKVL